MISAQALLSIVAAALVTAVANVMIRAGIERQGGFTPSQAVDFVWQFIALLLQPLFAVGFVLYFVAALIWFRTIATAPLTIAYPLLVSITFLAVSLGAVLVWGEPITLRKVIGALVILVGISLISSSSASAVG